MKAILMNRLQTLQQMTNDNTYRLDHNSTYGGWRLVKVGTKGEEYGCFGNSGMEKRIPLAQMVDRLDAIIAGIEYGRSNPT